MKKFTVFSAFLILLFSILIFSVLPKQAMSYAKSSSGAANVWQDTQYFDPDIEQVGEPDPPEPVEEWQWEEKNLQYDHDNFDVYSKIMHGVKVVVAIHHDAGWDGNEQQGYVNMVFNSFARFWVIFQGFRWDEYRLIVNHEGHVGAAGIGLVDAYLFWHKEEGLTPNKGMTAHSIFHAWNALEDSGLYPEERQRELWFMEGATQYYENRAKALFCRDGAPPTLKELNSAYHGPEIEYYQEKILGAGDDMPLIEMGAEFDKTDKALNYYIKGELVTFLIDERLNEHGSSLDLLMREMYHRFNYGHDQYISEDIRDICQEMTDGNCGDIFNDYVFGDKPLPLDKDYGVFFQNTLDEPFISLSSTPLLYPVGIADVEELTGKPFNIDALRNVPMFIYMGDQDDNSMGPTEDRYEPDNPGIITRDHFGATPIERWPQVEEIYNYVGSNSRFVLYPGVGHEINDEMSHDVFEFFKNNMDYNHETSLDYSVIRIAPEDSDKNFHWPYFLLVPENPQPANAVLLVETNNSLPDDDPSVHEEEAQRVVLGLNHIARPLGSPVLMPAFHRPYLHDLPIRDLYTHALNWNTMTTSIEGLERLDLQLIEMIEDARERLDEMGTTIEDKVFIKGYSASGAFANRFTMLHPELIKAAAIGAPGGFPILPASHWPPDWTGIPSFIQVPEISDTGSYNVTWGSSGTNEVTYVLQECTNSSFTTGCQTYSVDNLNAPITGKADGAYYYRVKATKDGYDDSDWRVGENAIEVNIEKGRLQVFIDSQEAIQAGAQWRIQGTTTWYESGESVSNIPIGNHTIQFRTVPGWRPEETIPVTVKADETVAATGYYVEQEPGLPGVLMLLLDEE